MPRPQELTPSVVLLTAIAMLTGCATEKPMRDPSAYSTMTCSELLRERNNVAENALNSRESGSFGFFDALGYIAEGVAIGSGQTANAQQMNASNSRNEARRSQQTAEADAWDNRTTLLNKIIQLKKCG